MTDMQRGTRTRDASPAAAADASKWPMFDFNDEDCTTLELVHNAKMAAPT